MKLDCGPTMVERYAAAYARKTSWHRWFAWHPVRVGRRDCRWFEYVLRKGSCEYWYDGADWSFEYRPVAGNEQKIGTRDGIAYSDADNA